MRRLLFMPILLLVVSRPLTLRARRVAPLLEDDWTKRPHRAAECTFGKQIRELGSTWFADLGPPFGVMYCIKCECVPVQKKRRVVARVQCRNIKNECPKLTCDEPVLLPGRCCKSCPGEIFEDTVQDVPPQLSLEEEERSLKHFGTLLTGKMSLKHQKTISDSQPSASVANEAYNYVATGRFNFQRKNLYYSFYLSESADRPKQIQFSDGTGNILEEQEIPVGGIYQNMTGKLCGVWRRLPRDYRKLLKEERLHVSLVWEEWSSLTGTLSRYKGLSSEQYSSLLEPMEGADRTMSGAGATAIVTASSASAPSLHISLVFNGVFLPTDSSDVPLTIQLEHSDKNYVVFSEEITVAKPSNEVNFGEVRSAISGADLRLLTRGKLVISIMSKRSPLLKLTGLIRPRASCDMYQAVIASPPVAFGWAFIDRFGGLRYGVQSSNQTSLVDEAGGRRKLDIEDLSSPQFTNGTFERPGPRLLEPLFNGDLSLVLAADSRARFVQRPVAEARDTAATSPIFLHSSSSSSVVALIWASIDDHCSLHYELEVFGLADNQTNLALYLETMPLLVPGAPVFRRLLDEFSGNLLEGSLTALSSLELYRIESGVSFLELSDQSNSKLVRGLFNIRAPLACLPHYADNDVASVVAYNLQPPQSAEMDNAAVTACYHESKFYQEGTQWTSSADPCSMCHCYRAVAQCDPVPCPAFNCPAGSKPKQMPGFCCPVCTNTNNTNVTMKSHANTLTKGCMLAGQFHLAGSSWHPYLPPSGFDTCAVCTCDSQSLEVKCPRLQCPLLDCDEKTAYRPSKKACCRQCPVVKPVTGLNGEMLPRDQAAISTKRSPEEILAAGGCKYPLGGPYENGKEWHPRIHSHGEIKCVKCRCKNGEVKCDRKRCTRAFCSTLLNQIKTSKNHVTDDCCSAQCRRSRRHHRNNHRLSKLSTTSRALS